MSWFDAAKPGSLPKRIETDIGIMYIGLGDRLSQFSSSLTMTIVSYIFAVYRGWQIAIVFTLMYPFMAFGGCLMMSALRDTVLETQGPVHLRDMDMK